MQTHISTTPFGRRAMTLGQIASQATAKAMPKEAIANKWQVFQHIREAREMLGATDRSLAILNALLSFHRETELSAEGELIVWPSNEQLMARANGISPATLRRHLSVLVECGLIIRRDSPNGKRFARRSRAGDVEQAYGFDLSPIVARAGELRDLAEAVQAEKKAFRVARERLTLLRRDIVKMIDAGIEEGVPGNWGRVLQSYQVTMSRLPRTASRQLIEDICGALHELHAEIRDVLESFAKTQNPNANESHSERHIQNSNPDSKIESEHGFREKKEVSGSAAETDNVRSLPKRDLPLSIVLDACPNLRETVQSAEIRHWRDFVAAAELVRTMLGISPSAWSDAREVMGEVQAAIALAAIYQRADQINSAGGYLRSLTDKARDGKFSTWPMIMALLRAKLDEGKQRQTAENATSEAGLRLEVSDSLLKSLRKRNPRP
uniref:plasmid replication protein RepC n=1 Tax=Aminobacter niigataensis TaxID=83265 RepID=UPI002852940D|nr:plasmid replication protein RepC [Aminobacter niigataensis]WMD00070.1 plasmid replication protein RepC [Aminobacter niigataensis]